MKWILFFAATVAGLIAVMAAAGSLLPRAHVASRRARFRQPAEAIWNAITDFASFPTWRPEVRAIEQLPSRDGHVHYLERSKQGNIAMEIMEAVRPERLVVRIADPRLPFGGSWTYQLSSESTETSLTITENGEVYNPIFRFLSRFVFGHQRSIDTYLRALGKRFGEDVASEPVA